MTQNKKLPIIQNMGQIKSNLPAPSPLLFWMCSILSVTNQLCNDQPYKLVTLLPHPHKGLFGCLGSQEQNNSEAANGISVSENKRKQTFK